MHDAGEGIPGSASDTACKGGGPHTGGAQSRGGSGGKTQNVGSGTGKNPLNPSNPGSTKPKGSSGSGSGSGNQNPAGGSVPESQSGTATVYRHGRGHYSVEVNQGSESLQTHQVTSPGQRMTKIVDAADVSPGGVTSSSRPIGLDANSALSKQKDLLKIEDLGRYDKITNSCVSHVCDVLQAGGVNTPSPNGSDQLRFILNLVKN